MKQFLRYQISGTVYIIWAVIFYYGSHAKNLNELTQSIHGDLQNLNLILGLVAALPIGVIIHQLSVLIKNYLFSTIWPELTDFPDKDLILKIDTENKRTAYILERISNLNSFYYVRFDNGFLSPFLAWITISCFMGKQIHWSWIICAAAIGLVTTVYLLRIYSEIKEYNKILNSN